MRAEKSINHYILMREEVLQAESAMQNLLIMGKVFFYVDVPILKDITMDIQSY